MPGFHHSVAVLPLPFRRSVVTFRCTVAVLSFRIATVAVAGKNGNAGNVFPAEIKTTSLTLGQFSGRLKTELFLRSYYASAQPS